MSEKSNELDVLKARATQLGINYSPNIGLTTLKAKINEKLGNSFEPEMNEVVDEKVKARVLSKRELELKNKARRRKEAMVLVHCTIVCNNPNKKHLQGEIISVANAELDDTRYVHFNVPYHVPQFTLNALKERKYQHFYKEKLPNGYEVTRTKLMPEFSISILPPLSEDEFNTIRNRQLARGTEQ